MYENCTFHTIVVVNCTASRSTVNGLFMFMDIQLNRFIFGGGSILLGTLFLCINYKGNFKKTRNIIIYLTCVIIGACGLTLPFYSIKFNENFTLKEGWFLISMGLILGQILFMLAIKVNIFLFTQFLGFLTGFCVTNTIEICYMYQFDSKYIEYVISAVSFAFISNVFNVNIYNHMFSYVGAFFIVRGAVILYDHSQIADIK